MEQRKKVELTYSQRESWERLKVVGQGLLEKSVTEGLPRFGNIRTIQKVLELDVANMDTPFIGIIGLISEIDGKETLIDFKTASSPYNDREVKLSDQLTAYQLVEPEIDQLALVS